MVDFNSGKGSDKFEQVTGQTGEALFDSFKDVCPDLAEYVSDFAFGHILSRPGLSFRDRELAAVSALAAIGTAERQLEVHATAALEAGCKPEELVECVLQCILWSGFPSAMNGLIVLRKVFEDRGIALSSGN